MTVDEFIREFQSVENNAVFGAVGLIEIVQQVLDDIYSDDSIARLLQPAPYLITADLTLEYSWETILPAYVDEAALTTIRRIKGIWDPSLTGQTSVSDYGRRRTPFFNQKNIKTRVYDGDIYVNNELKTIRFKNNPGTTTDKWKADLYLKAPRVLSTSQIPLLHGWEKKLLLPGCRAHYEELDMGKPGTQAVVFENQKEFYSAALLREYRQANSTEDNGIITNEPKVNPL